MVSWQGGLLARWSVQLSASRVWRGARVTAPRFPVSARTFHVPRGDFPGSCITDYVLCACSIIVCTSSSRSSRAAVDAVERIASRQAIAAAGTAVLTPGWPAGMMMTTVVAVLMAGLRIARSG